ncbi:MAG TPA: GyrI-like domain-containing protein [Spirochaetota bacterium]|nr:GyrI-like domain-containing protein [Spirochaetota bacterium]
MKKIITGLAAVTLFIIFVILGLAGYLGMFSSVAVTQKSAGPYLLVYEKFTGPYSETGPVQMKLYESLKTDGIETFRGFGIYLSDPEKVPASELRSEVGCIIEAKDYAKVKALSGRYSVKNFEKEDCVYAEFPIKNNLSYIAGVMTVYPALGNYIKKNGLTDRTGYSMEIYDIPAKKITYLFPLIK